MCKLIPLRVAHSKPFWVAQLNRCYQRSERLYLSVYSDVIKTEDAAHTMPRLRMNILSEKRQVLYASMWIWSSHFRIRHSLFTASLFTKTLLSQKKKNYPLSCTCNSMDHILDGKKMS